ncbi:MAG: ABC transporter ATP-binding protein [Thermoguttaceae bacterium]|jgi:putative ABC transport system ATP-binding protein|nr:ABC transporter ATP-binding protein [Thermoguttaceae bacterium]
MSDTTVASPVRRVVARIVDLRKDYVLGKNVVHALRGVSLEFRQGDFVAIMGASGSGKSTLLNLLGCLDKPTSGRYILAGQDVSQLDDYALSKIRSRYLGFIFQSYNLIPQLSVVENIQIPLQYQGDDSPAALQRCVRLAKLVGLGDRLDHRPTELSGGQQQRVAIARSLVNNPHVILADEPTGNLDSATGEEIMGLLDALNRAGRTIIMVTHEADIAAHAHRVVRLRDGRIEHDGTP